MDYKSLLTVCSNIPSGIKNLIVSEYKNLVDYVSSLLGFIHSHFNSPEHVLIGCLHLAIIIALSSIAIFVSKKTKKYIRGENESEKTEPENKIPVQKSFTKTDQAAPANKPKWKKPEPVTKSDTTSLNKPDPPKPKWKKPEPVTKPEVTAQNKPDQPKPKWQKPQPISTDNIDNKKVEEKPKPKWQKPQPINKENINKEVQETSKPKWKKLDGVNTKLASSGNQKKSSLAATNKVDDKTKTEDDTENTEVKSSKSWFGFGKSKDTKEHKESVSEEEKKNNKEDDTKSKIESDIKQNEDKQEKSWFSFGKAAEEKAAESSVCEGEKKSLSESFLSILGHKADEKSENVVSEIIENDDNKKKESTMSQNEDLNIKEDHNEQITSEEKDRTTGRRFPTTELDIQPEEEEVVATWKPERTFHLNIDPKPRSRQESNKIKKQQINLVKVMGSRFREIKKMDESEAELREDKLRDKAMIAGARTFFLEEEKRAQSLNPVQRMKLRTDDSLFDANKGQTSEQKRGFAAGRLRSKDFEMFEEKEKADDPVKVVHKKKLITLDQVIKKDSSNLDRATDWKEKELENLKEARPTPLLKRWNPAKEHVEQNESLHKEIEEMKQAHPTPVVKRWKPADIERTERVKSLEVPNKLKIDEFHIDTSKEDELKKDRMVEIGQIRESRPTPLVKRWKPPVEEPAERSKSVSCVPRAKLRDDDWNVNDKSVTQEEETRMKTAQEIEHIRKERAEAMETDFCSISENKEMQLRKKTEEEIQEIIATRTQTADEEVEIGRQNEIELKQRTRRELEQVKQSRKDAPKQEDNIKKVLKTVSAAELNEVKTARIKTEKIENKELKNKSSEAQKERARELEAIKEARISNIGVEDDIKEDKLTELRKEKQIELDSIKVSRLNTAEEVDSNLNGEISATKIESIKNNAIKEKSDKNSAIKKKEALKAKKIKKMTGIEENKVKAAKQLISSNDVKPKEERTDKKIIKNIESSEVKINDQLKKMENDTKVKPEKASPKTMKIKSIGDNHEEEREKARTEEVNRRAKELAELALKLQKSRENQEAPTSEEEDDLPDLQKVEMNQRLQELAQLAKCGTLDIAIAIAAESVAFLIDTKEESEDMVATETSSFPENEQLSQNKNDIKDFEENELQNISIPQWHTQENVEMNYNHEEEAVENIKTEFECANIIGEESINVSMDAQMEKLKNINELQSISKVDEKLIEQDNIQEISLDTIETKIEIDDNIENVKAPEEEIEMQQPTCILIDAGETMMDICGKSPGVKTSEEILTETPESLSNKEEQEMELRCEMDPMETSKEFEVIDVIEPFMVIGCETEIINIPEEKPIETDRDNEFQSEEEIKMQQPTCILIDAGETMMDICAKSPGVKTSEEILTETPEILSNKEEEEMEIRCEVDPMETSKEFEVIDVIEPIMVIGCETEIINIPEEKPIETHRDNEVLTDVIESKTLIESQFEIVTTLEEKTIQTHKNTEMSMDAVEEKNEKESILESVKTLIIKGADMLTDIVKAKVSVEHFMEVVAGKEEEPIETKKDPDMLTDPEQGVIESENSMEIVKISEEGHIEDKKVSDMLTDIIESNVEIGNSMNILNISKEELPETQKDDDMLTDVVDKNIEIENAIDIVNISEEEQSKTQKDVDILPDIFETNVEIVDSMRNLKTTEEKSIETQKGADMLEDLVKIKVGIENAIEDVETSEEELIKLSVSTNILTEKVNAIEEVENSIKMVRNLEEKLIATSKDILLEEKSVETSLVFSRDENIKPAIDENGPKLKIRTKLKDMAVHKNEPINPNEEDQSAIEIIQPVFEKSSPLKIVDILEKEPIESNEGDIKDDITKDELEIGTKLVDNLKSESEMNIDNILEEDSIDILMNAVEAKLKNWPELDVVNTQVEKITEQDQSDTQNGILINVAKADLKSEIEINIFDTQEQELQGQKSNGEDTMGFRKKENEENYISTGNVSINQKEMLFLQKARQELDQVKKEMMNPTRIQSMLKNINSTKLEFHTEKVTDSVGDNSTNTKKYNSTNEIISIPNEDIKLEKEVRVDATNMLDDPMPSDSVQQEVIERTEANIDIENNATEKNKSDESIVQNEIDIKVEYNNVSETGIPIEPLTQKCNLIDEDNLKQAYSDGKNIEQIKSRKVLITVKKTPPPDIIQSRDEITIHGNSIEEIIEQELPLQEENKKSNVGIINSSTQQHQDKISEKNVDSVIYAQVNKEKKLKNETMKCKPNKANIEERNLPEIEANKISDTISFCNNTNMLDSKNITAQNKNNEGDLYSSLNVGYIHSPNKIQNITEEDIEEDMTLEDTEINNQIEKATKLKNNTDKLLEKSRAAKLYIMQVDDRMKQQKIMELKKEISKELEEVKAARLNLLDNETGQDKVSEIRKSVAKELEEVKVVRSNVTDVDDYLKYNKVSEIKKGIAKELAEVKAARLNQLDNDTKQDKVSEIKKSVAKELEEVKAARSNVMEVDEYLKFNKVTELKKNMVKELEAVKAARLQSEEVETDIKQDKVNILKNEVRKELEEVKAARLQHTDMDDDIKNDKVIELKLKMAKELEEVKVAKLYAIYDPKKDKTYGIQKLIKYEGGEESIATWSNKINPVTAKESLEGKSEINEDLKIKQTLTFSSFEKGKKNECGSIANNEKLSKLDNKSENRGSKPTKKESNYEEVNVSNQYFQSIDKQHVKAKVKQLKDGILKTASMSKIMKSKPKEEYKGLRNEEVERRTKILADLALDLQRSKNDDKKSALLQAEINRGLAELAQMADGGTLDWAIDITAVSLKK